jgi:hypothetical protein
MNTIITVDQATRDRLAELDLEIKKLERDIRCSYADEELLSRIGRGSVQEIGEIADERGRLQVALGNLLKEQGELTRQ